MKIPKETIQSCIDECLKCIQYCENFEACMADEKECETSAKQCVIECITCSGVCSKLVKELEAYVRANVENRDMLTFKPYISEMKRECGTCIFICDACSKGCETSLEECRVHCKKCIEACYACIAACKKALQALS